MSETQGRKFYRTLIQVEVVSEGPYDPQSIEQLRDDIINGDCSGKWEVVESEEVSGKEVVALCATHETEPSFFRLGADGNDLTEG